jgi:hypothetical protein
MRCRTLSCSESASTCCLVADSRPDTFPCTRGLKKTFAFPYPYLPKKLVPVSLPPSFHVGLTVASVTLGMLGTEFGSESIVKRRA